MVENYWSQTTWCPWWTLSMPHGLSWRIWRGKYLEMAFGVTICHLIAGFLSRRFEDEYVPLLHTF